MAKHVNVGFIGCGGNALGHMRVISRLEGVTISAVCDVQQERAYSAGKAYGATPYTNHREMLDRAELNAVYISIPVFAHGEPELDVMERGLPFLVEKPVARDLETALRIAETVEAKSVITCVGYQLRYCGSADLAREALSGSTIALVAAKYWSGTGRGDPDRWIRQMKLSGGQLVEQATHTVDMIRYLVGEVKEVFARTASRQLYQIDCPDTHCLVLEFENGALGSMTAVWAYDPNDWSHANIIDIEYDQALLNWTSERLAITHGGRHVEETRAGGSIDAVFLEAARTGDSSNIRSPYADGVKSLAVSLAALTSAEQGKPVRVQPAR